MVVDDILWKLFRKSLSPSLYEKIRLGAFGRPDKYCSIKTYEAIFNNYSAHGLNFKDKIVVEIGPGLQFYTSFFFLTHGAKKVLLVEPSMPPNYEEIANEHHKEFYKEKKVDNEIDLKNIECFKSLYDIPVFLNNKIDCICSNFVLEHFTDLNEYFFNTARLLTNSGIAYAHVDFTDHTYHIFDSRKSTRWLFERRKLYHLQYSNKMYNLVSDTRTKSNRVLFPMYRKLAMLNSLNIDNVKFVQYRKSKISHDLLTDLQCNEDEINSAYGSFILKRNNFEQKRI